MALLALGEGWHNNHHAFEHSARQGLEWWQFDLTWYVIKFLQAIGLATDVKVPTEIQKQRKASKTRILATQNSAFKICPTMDMMASKIIIASNPICICDRFENNAVNKYSCLVWILGLFSFFYGF